MDFVKLIKKRLTFGTVLNDRAFHISFGISKDYVAQVGVLMTSIAIANTPIVLSFHIFCNGLEEQDLQKLDKLAKIYGNIAITVYYVDEDELSRIKTSLRYAVAIFYRLISAVVLYREVERLLYLDSDMVCIGSLEELRTLELDDICLAVRDSGEWIPEHKAELGLPQEHRYFNSGVLYMNLHKWNEEHISEQAVDLLTTNSFSFPDQDALNILLKNRHGELPEKYNFFQSKCTAREMLNNTILLHYSGDIKPWHPWCKYGSKKIWYDYLSKSPWCDYSYSPRTYQENRLMGRVLRRQGKYVDALSWYWKYVTDKIKTKTRGISVN